MVRELNPDEGPRTGRFNVHVSDNKKRRGSKIGTIVLLVVLVLCLGFGGYFWSDRPGLVKHVEKRDGLATPAAWVLRWQGVPSEAIPALQEALTKGSPSLRAASAQALGATRDREQVSYLGDAGTNDDDPSVRAAAIDGLREIGETDAARYMRSALDDDSTEVQAAACRAVGAIGLVKFIPDLINRLGHHETSLAKAALAGLEGFTEEGISYGFDQRQWHAWHEEGD